MSWTYKNIWQFHIIWDTIFQLILDVMHILFNRNLFGILALFIYFYFWARQFSNWIA